MDEKDVSGETIMSFPCEFTIKIIGLTSETFEAEVISIVRKHFPNLGEGAIKLNHSKEKKYLAYSVTLWVEEKRSLDDLYQSLSESQHVIFAL